MTYGTTGRCGILVTAGLLAGVSTSGLAKVGDCPPLVSQGIVYSSHGAEVQAVRQATGQLLWKTVLFTELYARKFDPTLEEDVQWNLACVRELRPREVVVTDSKGRTFRVSRADGRLVAAAPGGR